MKKFVSLFLLFAGIFCTQAAAYEDYGDSYWPKSYYIRANMGAMFTNGDLNERAISIKDTNDSRMRVYPPDISIMAVPGFTLGANVRSFSIDVSFQYSSFSESQTDNPDSDDMSTLFWNVGFEFTYNLFWPEDFQIGLGGGYTLNTVKASNSAVLDGETYRSEFVGAAAGFVANVKYYFSDYFAVVPSFRFYEGWFRKVYTKPSENYALDPYLWQTFISANLALQFQF